MGFKNIKGNVKNSFLDYFVSGKAVQYHTAEFGLRELPTGLTATGGVISDYTDGPAVYRAHIFTSTGTFTVTAPGGYGDTVEYLVVAGGGAGGTGTGIGYGDNAGGGAGGFRTNVSGHPLAGSSFPVSPGPYSVTVGAGGAPIAPGPTTGGSRGNAGSDSSFSSIT